MENFLSSLATKISNFCTRPVVFATITAFAIIWFVSGFIMQWSDLWNKIMDIPTTCLSFIMYFILLHAQNVDTLALHAKLDELIAATPEARDELEHLEEKTQEEIKQLRRD